MDGNLKPPLAPWYPELIPDPVWRNIALDMCAFVPVWGEAGTDAVTNLIDGRSIPIGLGTENFSNGLGGKKIGNQSTTPTCGFTTLTTDYSPITTSDGVGSGDLCMLSYCAPDDLTTKLAAMIGQREPVSAYDQVSLFVNGSAVGGYNTGSFSYFERENGVTRGLEAFNALDGELHVWGGQRIGSSRSIWKDGKELPIDASASPSAGARDIHQPGIQDFGVASLVGVGSDQWRGAYYWGIAVNRALTPEEHAHVAKYPMGVYQQIDLKDYFYLVAAAPGGWGHDVAGVANANILNVQGVAIANIGNVSGV